MDEEQLKSALELQALQLLRAFFKIGDPQKRLEVIRRAERLTVPAPDAVSPDKTPSNEAD